MADLIPHEEKFKVRSHSTLLYTGVANLIPCEDNLRVISISQTTKWLEGLADLIPDEDK